MRTDSNYQNQGQNSVPHSGPSGSAPSGSGPSGSGQTGNGHNATYGGQGYAGQGGAGGQGYSGQGFGRPSQAGQNFPSHGHGVQASGGGGRRPVHEVRIGRIKAAIWENHFRENGGTSFSVSFVKRYKRENQWLETHSLQRDDLLMAAKVLDVCHSWIIQQEHANNSGGHSDLGDVPS